MKYLVWLDGIVLDQDLTDPLYDVYKGRAKEYPRPVTNTLPDYKTLLDSLGQNLIFLSPFTDRETEEIMSYLGISLPFHPRSRFTKPSPEPMREVFSRFSLDPLDTVLIGSSPLDLLSSRFYDSRVKVVCIRRYRDCSVYSPTLMYDSVIDAVEGMKRFKLLEVK